MLLPGYVTVTLGILLFYPTFITGNNNNSVNKLPVEIFSVVVFIVAGPSVGFALWQIYLHISSFVSFNKDQFNRKYEFEREYGNLRFQCTDSERLELDSLDGRHIFGMSAAIGLGIVGLYALFIIVILPFVFYHSINCLHSFIDMHSILCSNPHTSQDSIHQLRIVFVISSIMIIAAILSFGSYFYNKRVRLIIICELMKQYNLHITSTCIRRERALKKRREKMANRIIRQKYPAVHEPNGVDVDNIQRKDIEDLLVKSDLFDKSYAKDTINELIYDNILILYPNKILSNFITRIRIDDQRYKEINRKRYRI
jgi:hypothetical protein